MRMRAKEEAIGQEWLVWTYGELNPDPCHAMAMFCR